MAPAPVYNPAFSWSGPYVGGFVGGNWAKVSPDGAPSLNSNGLTAGGLAGWNWAFPGYSSIVIGGEVEAGYNHVSQTSSYINAFGFPRSVSDNGSAEARARGRIGFAWDRFLLFAAGGGTAQDLRVNFTNDTSGFSQQLDHWRGGWNIGGGLEWAFADHWTIRGEYIYDRFGSRSYDFASLNPNSPANFGNRGVPVQQSTARAVLSYKF